MKRFCWYKLIMFTIWNTYVGSAAHKEDLLVLAVPVSHEHVVGVDGDIVYGTVAI